MTIQKAAKIDPQTSHSSDYYKNINTLIVQARTRRRPKTIEKLFQKKDFNQVNLVTSLQALATISNGRCNNDCTPIAINIFKKFKKIDLNDLSFRGIANSVWAFSKLGIHDAEFMNRLGEVIVQKLAMLEEKVNNNNKYNAQALANIVWGYARLGCPNQKLFDKVGEAARSILHKYNPQNLSNTFSAYAKIGFLNTPLFVALAQTAIKKMPLFRPSDIEETAAACAKLDFCDVQLMQQLGDAAHLQYQQRKKINIHFISKKFKKLKIYHKYFNPDAILLLANKNKNIPKTFKEQEKGGKNATLAFPESRIWEQGSDQTHVEEYSDGEGYGVYLDSEVLKNHHFEISQQDSPPPSVNTIAKTSFQQYLKAVYPKFEFWG